MAGADVLVGFEKKKLLLGESTPVLPILMQTKPNEEEYEYDFEDEEKE